MKKSKTLLYYTLFPLFKSRLLVIYNYMPKIMTKKNESEMQLDMNYGGDYRFMNVFRTPSFFTNIELAPSLLAGGHDQLREMFKLMLDDSRVCASVVLDYPDGGADAAKELADMATTLSCKPVVNFVSGAERSFEDITRRVSQMRSLGYRDFVAVTGAYKKDDSAPDYSGKYTDSNDIIHLISDSGNDNFIGASVNPFKYIQEDSCAQYAKLARKINSGARYVVVQTGWDMKKYQELLWFLRSRDFFIPLIARIEVLDRAAADKVIGDNRTDFLRPGVQLPLYVASKLARERELDDELFFNAQIERAAFIAAGCELMGYSGIQVAGLSTAHELEAFLDSLDGIMGNCQSYAKWVQAWNERFDSVTFVPFSKEFAKKPPYYLYNALLNPAVRDFSAAQSKPSQLDIQPPSIADKVQSRLADPDTPEWIKKTVERWTSKPIANEDRTHILGLENISCPKRLLKGPCGDSRCDGVCPHADIPCFFQRILRLAIWNRQMDFLEGREQ